MRLANFFTKVVFSLFVFLGSFGFTLEIDYASCKNIQEIINLETELILKCGRHDFENLTNLYTSRGETHLLNNQIDDAINDFSIAYTFLEKIQNNKAIEFRLLFNEIVLHVMLNNKNEVKILGEYFISLFDEICAQRGVEKYQASLLSNSMPIFLCGKTKIVGPDQEPYPGWCKEVVLSTGVALAQLISTLPRNAAKIALGAVVAILEDKALNCCLAGGLWKACVGPLTEKFNNWNQKWKVLGIPPDPAWD